MTARIYALCNQKGGVGKSTTAFHLARAAVLGGRRVLLVDNDPQGNLTSVTAAEPVEEDQAGLADVLSARAGERLRDVIVAGIWPGLDLVPTAGSTLGIVRDELIVAGPGREGRLREALAGHWQVGDALDPQQIAATNDVNLLRSGLAQFPHLADAISARLAELEDAS